MSKRSSPAVIGGFVVGAVALAITGVAVFGSGRLFRHTKTYVMYFRGDVNGLNVGAPVKFKGVPVGAVKEVLLRAPGATTASAWRMTDTPLIPVLIDLDLDRIRERGGAARVEEQAAMKEMIDAGLRAQLAMESFVTGLLYVKLDRFAGTPVRLVADPGVPYEELPTVPTPLEELQNWAQALMKRLESVDFEKIVKSLDNTVAGIDRLVNSEELKRTIAHVDETVVSFKATADSLTKLSNDANAKVGPVVATLEASARNADAAMRAATHAFDGVQTTLNPNSPAAYELRATLQEVANAARSVRELANYLERNPGALVRGKPAPEENKR
jgi:paraquat-inducible protein B